MKNISSYTTCMKAFILAGGFATRLWPLTEKRAKPLLPLVGKPIINYMVDQLEDVEVTVSTNAQFEEGFNTWKEEYNYTNVKILIEETKNDDQKLGALGAVAEWITSHSIDDDVFLLTGDNYFGFKFKDFLDDFDNATPLIAAYDVGELAIASSFGTVILNQDSQKFVEEFEEKPVKPRSSLVSTGCSLLPKSALPLLVEYAKDHPDNVGGIFEHLLQQNLQIQCYTFDDPWFDIGSFQAYIEATKQLVGTKVLCESSSSISTSQTKESVVIGHNCTINNCELTNVVIFDNCTLEDCILEDCIIDNHTNMKHIDLESKMLRENTRLIKN